MSARERRDTIVNPANEEDRHRLRMLVYMWVKETTMMQGLNEWDAASIASCAADAVEKEMLRLFPSK